MKQRTLGGSFSLKSKGLHTGLDLTVTMKPAPADTDTSSAAPIWKDSLWSDVWPRT